MDNQNILISGAGIAGTSLAFWLGRFGFKPTIVESSPVLREGGYAIDFMGAGYDVAEKMGIISALGEVDINFTKIVFVDSGNRETGSMNYGKIKDLMGGRALTILRSDLANVIYQSLDKSVEMIFGDSIAAIEQNEEAVSVVFQSGLSRKFDLVVGADGLHSNVRRLVFGDEVNFEKYLGYYTSSFTIDNLDLDIRSFSMYNVPGKQAAIYARNGGKCVTFFIFAAPGKLSFQHHDHEEQKRILKSQFQDTGWICAELLTAIDATTDFYFDSVSQIRMASWHKGRVVLVGDAGYCPSLLSGKGSTLAMVGAYILAGELKRAKGDFRAAFDQYTFAFKPFMDAKQKDARTFAKSFVPKTAFGIWLRNMAFKLMSLPFISKSYLGQFKDLELKLMDY